MGTAAALAQHMPIASVVPWVFNLEAVASTLPKLRGHVVTAFESSLNEREARLRVLADKLFFTVEKTGEQFTLKRTVDVEEPVYESNLSLDQAEQLLQSWKLRGLHGG